MEEKTKAGQRMRGALPRLIFLGTPDFALPSLQKLIEGGASIPLVVTQPDRPRGRGKKVLPPPVKVLAQKLELPVYQPNRLRDQEVIGHIRSFEAECLVVVSYGQLTPKDLLETHPLGAINVHPSLLPRHRGAAPIQRTLLSGDNVTGVSIMLLDEGIDTGPVLSQKQIPVREEDSFGTLHDQLAQLGGNLLCETLREWRAGRLMPRSQEDYQASYAPPVRKEELHLQWGMRARDIVNTIRAFDPWPGAYSIYQGKRLKCFQASLLPWKGEGKAGEILGFMETGFVVLGGDGQAVSIRELQLEGHRRLDAPAFVRGHSVPLGSCLE
jgi:methionyl-tRNA formyltransferase